jgi:hypothetical protein
MNAQEWKLIDRAKEPSTWASIGTALGMFGLTVPGPTWQAITMVGSGLALLAGILLKEAPAS